MMEKMLVGVKVVTGILILIALFLAGFFHETYADGIEQKFKSIYMDITKEASKAAWVTGLDTPVSDEQAVKERLELQDWQKQLRNLIDAEPDSIWADDAAWVICFLYASDTEKKARELESIIKRYPNFHIEDWAKKTFPLLGDVDSYGIRFMLCDLYKTMGNSEKLSDCCKNGVSKFPKQAKLFEKLLNDPQFSQTK